MFMWSSLGLDAQIQRSGLSMSSTKMQKRTKEQRILTDLLADADGDVAAINIPKPHQLIEMEQQRGKTLHKEDAQKVQRSLCVERDNAVVHNMADKHLRRYAQELNIKMLKDLPGIPQLTEKDQMGNKREKFFFYM